VTAEEIAPTAREAALATENARLREKLAGGEPIVGFTDTETLSALRDTEGRLRFILESATDFAIITSDLAGHITGWNAGARNILGWEEAEVLGRDGGLIWTPEDRAAHAPEAEMRAAREFGRAVDERWHVKRDGSRFWGSGYLTPMHDGTGALLGYVKILRDHTEQRLAIAALRASEERLRLIVESAVDYAIYPERSGVGDKLE
jgi:PAS domain S-box-containing protein